MYRAAGMSGDFVTGSIAVEESVCGLDRMLVHAAHGFDVDEGDSIRLRHQLRRRGKVRLI
jgi:hypothetical protein